MMIVGTVLAFLRDNPLYILAGLVGDLVLVVFVGKMIKRGHG